MKIRLVGTELFHVGGRAGGRMDRQADGRDEAHSRFSHFCERTK